MKTELSKTEISALLPHIKRVLETGKPWKDETMHHPAGAIIDAVSTIKGMTKKANEEGNEEGFDMNGWQWDWWQYFECNGKQYTLSGSGYYGGHAFNISD